MFTLLNFLGSPTLGVLQNNTKNGLTPLQKEPMRIGSVQVNPGVLLAPMEDVSALPFRLICRQMGADIVYTEFVNAEGLVREDPYGPRRTFRKLRILDVERPVAIQIYGASELSMEKAAEIATTARPDFIDINCGCWVRNVALRGAGAGLLRDIPRLCEVVRRVKCATDLPITVKTRLGWDSASIQIVDVARRLEDIGVAAIAIHCRTRAQGHKGAVDYNWIARVKEYVSIPIILNGDIASAQDVERAFVTTGCDGVMIGRAAIVHPWIFRETQHYLRHGQIQPEPGLRERAELCLRHLDLCVEHEGERGALLGMRRHYTGYFRSTRGASRLRAQLTAIKELEALRNRLSELRDLPPATVNEIAA